VTAPLWRLAETWKAQTSREAFRFRHGLSGLTLELPAEVTQTWCRPLEAFQPVNEATWLSRLGPFERASRQEVFAALRSAGVVRRHHPGLGPRLTGGARSGLPLPSQDEGFLPVRVTWSPVEQRSSLRLGHWGKTFFITAPTGPCPRCLGLRVAPTLGLTPRGQPSPLQLREALMFLDPARPLKAEEAVVVLPRARAQRVPFVRHPDCDLCRHERPSAASVRSALTKHREKQVTPHAGLSHPLTGALEIHVDTGAHYPLKAPFVWGRVRLVRARQNVLADASTTGGLYGKGRTEEEGRKLAFSEGCERLMGMSVPFFSPPTVSGLDLVHGKEVKVPVEEAAVRLPKALQTKPGLSDPFYSGCASHLTFTRAVVHATLELLERDAFLLAWYRAMALPGIVFPRELTPLAKERAAYLRRHGMALSLFDLRVDFPFPALLLRVTAQKTQGHWPAGGQMVFASCAFHAPVALERALGLACGQMVSMVYQRAPEKDVLDPRRVKAMDRHAPGWALMVRYLDPANADAVRPLVGQPPTLPFSALNLAEAPTTPRAELQRLVQELRRRSLPLIALRLTDTAVADSGLEVAKVLVPGLLRLAPTRQAVDLKTSRAWHNWRWAQVTAPRVEPHPLY